MKTHYLRPTKHLFIALIVLLGSMLLIDLILLVPHLDLHGDLLRFYSEWRIRQQFSKPIMVLELAHFLIYLATIVVYLIWFGRTYRNMHRLGYKRRFPPLLAYFSWFIPLFHWVGPFLLMRDIHVNYAAKLQEQGIPQEKSTLVIFYCWWALYIGCGIFLFTSPFEDFSLYDEAHLQRNITVSTFLRILNMLLNISALLVVLQVRFLERTLLNFPEIRERPKANETVDLIDSEIDAAHSSEQKGHPFIDG